MKLQGYVVVALIALASSLAIAATINASWTNATQNTDGSAIPATGAGSLVSTTVEYGTCNGNAFGTKIGEVTSAGTGAVTPNLGPGRYCARAFHTNTYGEVSDPSAVGIKVIASPKPNPPSNFSFN